MSERRFVLALVLSLTLASLITGAQAVAIECVDVEPGQVVSYQGPDPAKLDYVETPTYYYKWSAEVDGSEIASGVDKDFSFTTPDVTPEEGMKTVIVTLLVTDGYGCIGETTQCLSVYAFPTCGIGGPDSVCQDSPVKEFYYSGEDTTTAEFAFTWSIDKKEVGSGEAIDIDWSPFKFGDHVLTLKVDKTYEGGMTVSTSCEKSVKYVESPAATIKLVGVV
jgi:hypothetical protein